jgi:hypothetical protein
LLIAGKPTAHSQPVQATDVGPQIPDQAVASKCLRIMKGEEKDTVESYSNETDCTLALTAAWHRYVHPGLPDQPLRPQRFLGFVEGRTGVAVPIRWQLAVIQLWWRTLEARASEMESYFPICPFLKKDTPYPGMYAVMAETYRDRPPLSRVAPDLDVVEEGPTLVFKQGPQTIRVKSADLNLHGRNGYDVFANRFSGLLTHDLAFLARYDDLGNPYSLYCFNAPSGQLRWKALCWGEGPCLTVGGNSYHWVWLAASLERIAVFGDTGGPYLEVFEKSNGKSLGRFSGDCWREIYK